MNKPYSNQKEAQQIIAGSNTVPDLEDIQNMDGFDEAIDRDFGSATEGFEDDGVSRRRWLQIMGASLALGGAAGCRFEEEKIVPFAFRPQGRIPGIPETFASMIEFGGVAQPIMSTNFDGRPIKLDGNKSHPSSMGASTAFTQATILEFYDPDRLRAPLKVNPEEKLVARAFTETTTDEILGQLTAASQDAGSLAILAEPTSSPSVLRMKKALEAKGAKWYTFASVNDDNVRAGAKAAFGKVVRPHYQLDKAKVIITLDADILGGMDADSISNAIGFGKGRDADHGSMSRMYSIESQFSQTGASADHRLSVRSSDMGGFLGSLVAAIEGATAEAEVDKSLPYRDRVLAAMAQDFIDNPGSGVIVVGNSQPAEVHAMAHYLNEKYGNAGKTVVYTESPDADRDGCLDSLQKFVDEAASIGTLVVLGGNPAFAAAGIAGVGEAIASVPNSMHVSFYRNETSKLCKWVSNVCHPLESWSDGAASDGSVCVGQPLINPLFGGLSVIETLAVLATGEQAKGIDIVKESVGVSGEAWTKAVHDGFVADTKAKPADVKAGEASIEATDAWKGEWDGKLEVVFHASRSVYDGRYANNGWLQELPDFISKHTWDGIISVSPKTAEALGLVQSTKATVTLDNGESVRLPVNVQPGQANGSIGLPLGYGRTMAGRVGGDLANRVKPVGQSSDKLRTADTWNFASGLDASIITGSGTNYKLALIQEPWTIDEKGRGEIQNRMFRNKEKNESDRSSLIREGTLESYQAFLEKHPIGEHDHDDHSHDDGDHGHDEGDHDEARSTKLPKSTSLPIVTNVSFNPGTGVPVSPAVIPAKVEEEGDHDHDDDHGHGHKAQWPEAFHMHHELFDLTKGAREDYTAENPAHENVWGMSIDLNKCIGCNSCVTSCQAENNVPVVGRAEVWRGREMHWLRIDRYYGNNLYNKEAAESDDKVIVHQPVACHHCENAPCETVCPVAATVHSREGLNDMVYNRCIGTRYCGNNCPYKVRRFNFFNYSDAKTFLKYPGADKLSNGDRNLQNLMMNPEVTIRSRGVMEKCSYCVQRIQNTKIQAKAEGNRKIGPNEIRTACQDACPTQAIEFGDLNNKASKVAKAHANPRAYTMLEELNNRPRTKYLARVANPHPALVDHDDRDSVSKVGH
ncbi:Fe-S-cluster-containing hydrogenase [Mariniblastus fucicola]|uniref:Tetrathionate reductase subunit B n=1 Tax=Mariniblastus fucicola TaxID=980251 RepID=A0A5B9P6J2_9BACT|nr:Fe-S-cluster-containing hydrogenase [Mariniblastus fucicola]QEG20276.1 Tetrathionate reductase subunit B precursor [Mariniblastus fucicola]